MNFLLQEHLYIATKHLHHSQQIIEQKEDGQITIQLKVILNPTLESFILSFGCNVKVLQPESLKEKIHAIAQEMLKGTELSRAILG